MELMGPTPLRVAGVGAKHSPLHPGVVRMVRVMRKIEFRVEFSKCPGLSQKSSRSIVEPSGDALELLGRLLNDLWGVLNFSKIFKILSKKKSFFGTMLAPGNLQNSIDFDKAAAYQSYMDVL